LAVEVREVFDGTIREVVVGEVLARCGGEVTRHEDRWIERVVVKEELARKAREPSMAWARGAGELPPAGIP
jgi:hypothetical protein